MKDKISFLIKEQLLTDMELKKLSRLLSASNVYCAYDKCPEGYKLDIEWDQSEFVKKTSRYAGRHKDNIAIDWDEVKSLSDSGMKNSEIAAELGINLRTFYRRKKEAQG